jgi:hypothetical protein
MITDTQPPAVRALLSFDQRQLVDLSGLTVPTSAQKEGSKDMIRGNVDFLMDATAALEGAGGGSRVRLQASRTDSDADRRNPSAGSGLRAA